MDYALTLSRLGLWTLSTAFGALSVFCLWAGFYAHVANYYALLSLTIAILVQTETQL